MRGDLHVHSTASDGTLSPAELVQLAARNGVDVLALADHDSVSGIQEAVEMGSSLNVRVIPAVELSAAMDETSIHVLGYFVSITDATLLAALDTMRTERIARATEIVRALQAAGYDIDLDAVLSLSAGGSVGRTHIARTLVSLGHATSVADAFERLVGRGGPFYRPKSRLTPSDAIQLVRSAGGIAVIAHPGVSGAEQLIEELAGLGIRGVEAYHVDHTAEQTDRLVAIADRLGLLKTGGTDYHSPHAPHPDLGDLNLPEEDLVVFLAAGDDAGCSTAAST